MNPTGMVKMVVIGGAVFLVLVAAFVWGGRRTGWVGGEAESVAVGLRGTNRVSKAMSARQRERFENHMLDTPRTTQPLVSPGLPSAVSQAQAINSFNKSQNQ